MRETGASSARSEHRGRGREQRGQGRGKLPCVVPCAVRVLKPALTSFMHVSCHVHQPWRQRQEVARGDGHLRHHR